MESTTQTFKTQELDIPLHTFGFEFQELSPEKVTGRLHVTQICCQARTSTCLVLSGISSGISLVCPNTIFFLF